MESKRLSTNICSDYSDDEISFGPRSRTTTPSLSQPSTPLRPLVEEEHVDVHSPKAMPKTGMQLDIKKLNLTPKSEIRCSLEPIASNSLSCQRMIGFDDVGETTEKELLAHACDCEAIGESTKKDIIEGKFAEDFDQLFDKEVEAVKNSHNISITDLCDSITKMDLDCSMEKRGSLSKNTSPYVPGEVRTEIHNLGNLLLSEVNKSSTTVFISEEEEEELLGGSFHGQEEDPHVGNVSQFDHLLDQEDSKVKCAKPDEIKMSEIVKYYEHKYNRSFDQIEAEQVEGKENEILPKQNYQVPTDTITLDAVTTVNPVEETVESGVYEGVGESSFLYKSLDIPKNEDSFVVLPNPVSGEERLSKSQFQEFAVQASHDVSDVIPPAQVISPEKISPDESVIVIPEPHNKTTGDDISEINLSAYLVGNDLSEKPEVEEENSEADLSKYLGQDENFDGLQEVKTDKEAETEEATVELLSNEKDIESLDDPVLHKIADHALQNLTNTEEKPGHSNQESSNMDDINLSEQVGTKADPVYTEVEQVMVKGEHPAEIDNVNSVSACNEEKDQGICIDENNPMMAKAEQVCIEVNREVTINIVPEPILGDRVASNNLDNELNLVDSKTIGHTESIDHETEQVCLTVGAGNNEVTSNDIETCAVENMENQPICCSTESVMLQAGDEGGLQINDLDKTSTKGESETSILGLVENESFNDVRPNADHLATEKITLEVEQTDMEVDSSNIGVELSNFDTDAVHLETATVTRGCEDKPSIFKVDQENIAGRLVSSMAQAAEERSEMITSDAPSDKSNTEPLPLSSVVGEEPIIGEVRAATVEDEIEIMDPEDESSSIEIKPSKTETEPVRSKDETFSSKEYNIVAEKEHCELEKDSGEVKAEQAEVNIEPASCNLKVEPINYIGALDESVNAEVGPELVGGEVIPTSNTDYTEQVNTESEHSNLEVGLNKSDSEHASYGSTMSKTEYSASEMKLVGNKAKPYTIECESDAVKVELITSGVEPTCIESVAKTEENNSVNNELELEQAEGDSEAAEFEPVKVESEPTVIESESKTEEVNNELEVEQAEGDSEAAEFEPVKVESEPTCIESESKTEEVNELEVEQAEGDSEAAEFEPVKVETGPTCIESQSKTEEVNNELEVEQAEGDSEATEFDPVKAESEPTCIESESKTEEVNELEVGQAEGDSEAAEFERVKVECEPTCLESEPKTEEVTPVNKELDLEQAESESKGVEVEPVAVDSETTTNIESESKTEDYGPVNNEREIQLADVKDESEVEVQPAGGECESEAVEVEPVTVLSEPTRIDTNSETVEVNLVNREFEVEESRLPADSNEIPAECPVDQPESSQAVTDLSRIEEEEIPESDKESPKIEDEDFVIMRPDFLEVEDESDGLGPLRSRDSMSSVKSRESLGLLPPSYLANIDNDDLFISQVNSPSVLFGEKEKNYLKRVFKAPSPMYRGQQIVMQKSKRGRAEANTPTSCRPKPFCEEQKRTPVKAVHSTTSKPALHNKVANSPLPNKAEKRPPTPTTTKGNSKAPRPSTLPCMAPQRAEIQGEKSTFAAFRAKVGTPVSKAPASPVSKSASVGDIKQPWIPPSPRPHLQRAPASPRARPASPFGTPKKSQSYESSGRVMTPQRDQAITPQRDQAMTPKRDPPKTPTRTDPIQTKPRSNFKRPPVIATPPRVAANKKKPCTTATPPRCKATYSSSKSTTAGTLLTENDENAAPSVAVKKQATPRVKSGATSTPAVRNRTSISKPATPKVRSSTSKAAPIPNRGLSKPGQPTSDSTESAKKKPVSRPKLNSAAPKIGGAVSKINTGLAGRSDMKKLADKSKVAGTKPSATPATKRPVLGSLENKTSKQEEISSKSKPVRTSIVTKSSSGDTAVTGAKTGAAAKTGIPSRSRIPAPRSRLPTKLPTRSNK